MVCWVVGGVGMMGCGRLSIVVVDMRVVRCEFGRGAGDIVVVEMRVGCEFGVRREERLVGCSPVPGRGEPAVDAGARVEEVVPTCSCVRGLVACLSETIQPVVGRQTHTVEEEETYDNILCIYVYIIKY